jgi:RNA-directed DNA polymerase
MDAFAEAEGQEANGIDTQAQGSIPKPSLTTGEGIDRRDQSDPTGLGELLCSGQLQPMLLVYPKLVEKKVRRLLARACQRQGFGWKRWNRNLIYGTLGLFNEYRVSWQSLPKAAPLRAVL